jgi:hypothetical protein
MLLYDSEEEDSELPPKDVRRRVSMPILYSEDVHSAERRACPFAAGGVEGTGGVIDCVDLAWPLRRPLLFCLETFFAGVTRPLSCFGLCWFAAVPVPVERLVDPDRPIYGAADPDGSWDSFGFRSTCVVCSAVPSASSRIRRRRPDFGVGLCCCRCLPVGRCRLRGC